MAIHRPPASRAGLWCSWISPWAGGGIVADSVCESEYEECFNKIGAMLKALEDDFLSSANKLDVN